MKICVWASNLVTEKLLQIILMMSVPYMSIKPVYSMQEDRQPSILPGVAMKKGAALIRQLVLTAVIPNTKTGIIMSLSLLLCATFLINTNRLSVFRQEEKKRKSVVLHHGIDLF